MSAISHPSSSANSRNSRNTSSNNNSDERSKNYNKIRKLKIGKRKTPRYLQSTSASASPGCGDTSGTYHSIYLGCYDDKLYSRAMPFELYGEMSRDKRLGHSALDCERECSSRGYRYFAREYRGQCFCGNDEREYKQYGLVSGCNCCGENVGGGKMCVWEVRINMQCSLYVVCFLLILSGFNTTPF